MKILLQLLGVIMSIIGCGGLAGLVGIGIESGAYDNIMILMFAGVALIGYIVVREAK